MQTISINLLPVETANRQKKQKKFQFVQIISTGILLVLIFLASVTASLRILQTQNIKKIQAQAAVSEEEITSQKDKESQILILKSRLDTIGKYFGKLSKQTENYNYISEIVPGNIQVSSVTVDQTGTILIAVVAPNSSALSGFIEELLKSSDKISQVYIESLSRGRDSDFRANLRLEAIK